MYTYLTRQFFAHNDKLTPLEIKTQYCKLKICSINYVRRSQHVCLHFSPFHIDHPAGLNLAGPARPPGPVTDRDYLPALQLHPDLQVFNPGHALDILRLRHKHIAFR